MMSQAARAFAGEFIRNYGRIETLTIDSKRRRIEVVCRLNGEVSAIGVTIEEYRLEQSGGKTYLEVLASTATRPWLDAVLRDHLRKRRIALPPWAASAL